MHAGWSFGVFDLGEQPHQEDAEEAENRGPAEDVDVSPQQRLLAQLVVEESVGLLQGTFRRLPLDRDSLLPLRLPGVAVSQGQHTEKLQPACIDSPCRHSLIHQPLAH